MLQEVIEDNVGYPKSSKRDRLLYLLRDKKKRISSADLYFFAKYVLRYREIDPQPHRELCRILELPVKRKMILEPRGSFKSTICTVAGNILDIIRNPNIRILIDSEDVTNAKKFLSEIKMQFQTNDELKKLFGDYFSEATKWSESEIQVKRDRIAKEPTIGTSGIETTRVGLHFDKLCEDDLHSQFNTKTPEQRANVKDHWKLNQSILEPEGTEIVIGTHWHLDDLYGDIKDQERDIRRQGLRKFFIHVRPAIYDDGSLHFPSRLTHQFLQEKRIELGPALFNAQYQNNPLDESRLNFKESWIKFYGYYPPSGLTITSTLDPAISERDEACDTGIVTVGTDEDGYMHILDVRAMKENPTKVLDECFAVQRSFNPVEFGIETVAFQKSLKFWAWERSRTTGEWINFKELKTDTRVTKDMRIKALIPYIESGTILFPGNGPESLSGAMYQLYEQIVQYPVGKKRDLIDALAYQLQLYAPAKIKAKPKPKKDSIEALMEEVKKTRTDRGQLPMIWHPMREHSMRDHVH